MDALELPLHKSNSLMDSVRQMYKNHLDTGDVIFQVGKDGKKVGVHKFILMSRSSVFFSMFTRQNPPKTNLRLSNIDSDVFLQFVEFLYTDHTSVTAENIDDLLYCAKKYKIEFLSAMCKKSLKNFITTDIVCQTMELAKVHDDPEIVDICMKTVEAHMPSFLYSEMFLKMCCSCVCEIMQQDRILAPEDVIFERVSKWSEEECRRQNILVTAENQRKVLGDILYEIRFPIMDHQYLEDVVCRSDVLNDGEKVDILRQQLKSKKENPGMFKVGNRIWQPTTVMTSQLNPTRTMLDYVQPGCRYSLPFEVSSHAVLLGIYLNLEKYTEVQAQDWDVIISITPLELLGDDCTDSEAEFSIPLGKVKKILIELYPRYFIPLKKGVQYNVSVRLESKTHLMYSIGNITIKGMQQLRVPVIFNGKTLSVCGWSNCQLIGGFRMT